MAKKHARKEKHKREGKQAYDNAYTQEYVKQMQTKGRTDAEKQVKDGGFITRNLKSIVSGVGKIAENTAGEIQDFGMREETPKRTTRRKPVKRGRGRDEYDDINDPLDSLYL